MPLYEYICENENCKINNFEKLVKSFEEGEKILCPLCNKKPKKKISSFGMNLKGEGFHTNDYPTIDRLVGKDSERRWKKIHENQEAKSKFKDNKKCSHLSRDPLGDYRPTKKDLYKVKYKSDEE